jgi:hypothetical protein
MDSAMLYSLSDRFCPEIWYNALKELADSAVSLSICRVLGQLWITRLYSGILK